MITNAPLHESIFENMLESSKRFIQLILITLIRILPGAVNFGNPPQLIPLNLLLARYTGLCELLEKMH